MSTWIIRLEDRGPGLRVAVKDNIDVFGLPTTAGSPVVAERVLPAADDAACLAGLRAAGVRIVGKSNLHELACGSTGINPHYGTPTNPLDATRIPGGSSSGNATALAESEVDLAIGTDTAGSIRTPAACCGVVGLKTTAGRVSCDGVWPLAPTLDTVGPMARDVAGVREGMALLEPGFTADVEPTLIIGRVRLGGVDPRIDRAIDSLLGLSELEIVEVELVGWDTAESAAYELLLYEFWQHAATLAVDSGSCIGSDVRGRLAAGRAISERRYRTALAHKERWRSELARAFSRVPLLAWPTLTFFPPRVDGLVPNARHSNLPVNLAGTPALSLPVPTGWLPTSIQLVGPDNSEGALCATAVALEATARSMSG